MHLGVARGHNLKSPEAQRYNRATVSATPLRLSAVLAAVDRGEGCSEVDVKSQSSREYHERCK